MEEVPFRIGISVPIDLIVIYIFFLRILFFIDLIVVL